MPFKTKRQKQAAAQRRFVFTEGTFSLENAGSDKTKNTISLPSVKLQSTTSEHKEDLLFIKKDLLKTVLIASVIIGAQIVLFLLPFNTVSLFR